MGIRSSDRSQNGIFKLHHTALIIIERGINMSKVSDK
uniref:Uncharacterized protein n=1 Tax=Arundo donax TaxID=35708 RepID=A0A0A9GR15_ARUDO